MVQWAVTYFVYPKTILKWVNHLQEAKASGALTPDVWITSSDNYESWGGGNPIYHTQELTELMRAIDVSVHTYPFHDSFYNPSFWGVLPDEESLPFEAMTEATMQRAIAYAKNSILLWLSTWRRWALVSQCILETGWASIDETAYGAEALKQRTSSSRKSFTICYVSGRMQRHFPLYFEAFDEQWKKADSPETLRTTSA